MINEQILQLIDESEHLDYLKAKYKKDLKKMVGVTTGVGTGVGILHGIPALVSTNTPNLYNFAQHSLGGAGVGLAIGAGLVGIGMLIRKLREIKIKKETNLNELKIELNNLYKSKKEYDRVGIPENYNIQHKIELIENKIKEMKSVYDKQENDLKERINLEKQKQHK